MKQLLLRVPEDLHFRLAARARRDGGSINSVATAILDAAVDADGPDRMTQLRAKATAMGAHRPAPKPDGPVPSLDEVYDLLRGAGPYVMGEIAAGKDHLDRLP